MDELEDLKQKIKLISHVSSSTDYKSKFSELKKLKLDLNNKKHITISDFKQLREYALSEGGFLNNELRKHFYKKLFLLDNNIAKYELIYINDECENFYDYSKDSKIFTTIYENFDIGNISPL